MARLVRSLAILRREVDRAWPERDRSSDGWVGDAEHSSRVSDNNPDRLGRVHAMDLDVGGIDARAVVDLATLHPSARYVIWDRRIWSVRTEWEPRPYLGPNPHRTHLHVSVAHSTVGRLSRRSWLGLGIVPRSRLARLMLQGAPAALPGGEQP